jgi:hypothetical protein
LIFLETDKAQNVAFYQNSGFRICSKHYVFGVPNWFMQRPSVEAGLDLQALTWKRGAQGIIALIAKHGETK